MRPASSEILAGATIDWSTFFPDLIVAGVTGIVIGLVIMGAERWLSHGANVRATDDARAVAVSKSQRLLFANEELPFDSSSLLPLGDSFATIGDHLAVVPPGGGTPPTLAFQYLEEMYEAWVGMKAAASSVEAQLPAVIDRSRAFTGFTRHGAEEDFRKYMHSVFPPAHGPGTEPDEWQAWWKPRSPVPHAYAPGDPEFLAAVRSYLDERHRFTTYRSGLLMLNEPHIRQQARISISGGQSRFWWQNWARERKHREALRAALSAAERDVRPSVVSWLQAGRRSLGLGFDS